MAIKIKVHVRDQEFQVFCGDGNQKVRWLSDVALHRYEHFHCSDPGLAKGMRFEDGNMLEMDEAINENEKLLESDVHVWVILKEDLALMEAEKTQEM